MLTSSLFYLALFVFYVGANFNNNNSTDGSNSTVTIIITTTATIEPLPSGAGELSSAASNLDGASTASNSSLTAPTNTTSADLSKATGPVSKLPKRGIAYPAVNNPEDVLNINQTRSVVSWVYDWAVSPPDYLENTGIGYVPMQWGEGNIENLASIIEETGAKTLLAFNEPDFDEQSNLDPTYAADLWRTYIEPLKAKGVRLGGPAVTASGTGRPWLKTFFAACGNCSIDFLPLHWYGEGTEGFYNYLWEVHGEWPQYDIWITEYADTRNNYDDVLDFMNATATYMEGIEWIERYAWFGYFRPEDDTYYNMLHADGGLNALGEFYIGAGSVEKSGRATHSPTPVGGGPTRVLSTAVVGSNLATPSFSSASRVLADSHGWIIISAVSMVLFCLC